MGANEIQYVGEHLLPGQLGNLFVALSFIFSIFSMFAYFKAQRTGELEWKKLGRLTFRIHSLAVIGIASVLFYIIFNHYFEYNYAYQHSSSDLPLRYMLSCFWEGQEGSFLLWLFWHAVLGNVLIPASKDWENPVMSVFSSVQVVLGSMLLGIYVFGVKIGSSPFMLIRENPELMNIPLFQNPEYASLIEGSGLNPLLQNYWMTIHPPTLFLGFASTLVPFAFAIAALWTKKHTEWLKPAIPWTYFGVLILGAGVLMGGAWAYEALSFGGFWAWDPVENASLVPWLFLVGAAHLMILNRNKKKQASSLKATYLTTIFTFLLVLYSTYLTRSGILGESSVHSFADGMPGQLIFFLLVFVLGSLALYVVRYRDIPTQKQEENFMSREFWMFIGALVLIISAFQIIFTTSIPVINVIFGTDMAPPIDPIDHYNSWQVPFAIVIAILVAFSMFLSYRNTDKKRFLKRIIPSVIVALILTVAIAIALAITSRIYIILLFASLAAVLANADYMVRILKGKVLNAGASIAHVGFGLIILGALLSAGLKDVISTNTSGIDIRMEGEEEDANLENILLYKNDTLPMGPYDVTYVGKKREGINLLYEVYYRNRENPSEEFSLFPRIQLNKTMGNVPEPDTKHALTKDLFTYVTYVNEQDFEENPVKEYEVTDTLIIQKGDTALVAPYLAILEGIEQEIEKEKHGLLESDMAIKARLILDDLHNSGSVMEPILVIRENQLFYIQAEEEELGIRIALVAINPENGALTFMVERDKNKKEDFIIMRAAIFPYINVLWMGCIIMIIGTGIAIFNRARKL